MISIENTTLTSIEGILVGHAHDQDALTGCTVILCEGGAVGGVDQRGGAPGTRETDLLRPTHLVQEVYAILLSGGSAFGLDAASGVMRYLYERGVGFDSGITRIPIVPAAVIFDLAVGRADVFPNADMGYASCLNASTQPVIEGNVGAGIGASVAKIKGMSYAMKAGIGSTCIDIGGKLKVAALIVLNAFGDVLDAQTGEVLAAVRPCLNSQTPFLRTLDIMKNSLDRLAFHSAPIKSNTCIGVVATNARLTKEEVNKVAQMAQDGLARAINPSHTMFDGDTLFALATGKVEAEVNLVGAFAAESVAIACKRAVITAKTLGGVPGLCMP